MKKIIFVFSLILLLFSSAYASETVEFNQRYHFVECDPFFFVCPEGFSFDGQMWSNGSEFFSCEYQKGSIGDLLTGNDADILHKLDAVFSSAFGEPWCGALYAEKSGGCYKIGSLVQYEDAEIFFIVAACSEGTLVVMCSPADTSSGMDLAHGIFKTISYAEYQQS